jgi:DNA-binding NarL/FixJ family response regulator
MFASAIGMLLSIEVGASVVGEAHDGRSAVSMAQQLSPDLVVMDIEMPNLNGIEATRQIRDTLPKTKIIVLSGRLEKRSAIAILKAGANGLIPKSAAAQELANAFRDVIANKLYISPNLAPDLVQGWENSADPTDGDVFSQLSSREREVLQLIAEGRSTKQIANQLFISGKTVETHRRHIMEKLGVESIAELVKYAIRDGVTSVDLNNDSNPGRRQP